MIWNEAQRYPYAYGGRHVLHAALSEDEGRTWTNHREILRDPMRKDPPPGNGDWGVAYAFPTLTKSGDVIFSLWVQTGTPRTLYRLSPEWLEETHQSTNFEAGLEDWSIFGTHGVELISSPQAIGQVLAVRRAERNWPSGAVWNFPMGKRGQLTLKIFLQRGFGGDTIGLTDHYSVPFDDRDTFFNVFNVPISADGKLLSASLTPEQWHLIKLDWDTSSGRCSVAVNRKLAGVVQSQRNSEGIDYLRFHPTPDVADGGLLLGYAQADVSATRDNSSVAANASSKSFSKSHSQKGGK
jgi:hypothetical protein